MPSQFIQKVTIFILLAVTLGGCGNPATKEKETPQKQCDLVALMNTQREDLSDPYKNRAVFDTPSSEPDATFTDQADGSVEIRVQAGTAESPLHGGSDQSKSMRYFDLNHKKTLKISDKEAITQNKEWKIGIRAFEFYTNGGPYPGDIEVAVIKNQSFDQVTKSAAASQTFVTESPLLDGPTCKLDMRGQAGHTFVASAPTQLNAGDGDGFSNNYWFTITINEPWPHPKPYIYLLRDPKTNWIAKLAITGATLDSSTKAITYTIKYQVF